MKRLISLIVLIIVVAGFFYFVKKRESNNNNIDNNVNISLNQESAVPTETTVPAVSQPSEKTVSNSEIPLSQIKERIAKKPFGIYITPQNSPVQPERFMGYHTGTDFEILPGEENINVEARAICDGKIIYKSSVGGYGGVIIQSCSLNNENVTVLYGHISLAKSPVLSGTSYERDDVIAILGKGYSSETDGERKHLHLGIHKGSSIEFMGYVENQNQLSGWIDFQSL